MIVSAPRFTSSTKGIGDSVLIYQGGRGVANIVYTGGSNFVVKFYSGSNCDLLANEIGHYEGQVVFQPGPALVVLQATGWTISVK